MSNWVVLRCRSITRTGSVECAEHDLQCPDHILPHRSIISHAIDGAHQIRRVRLRHRECQSTQIGDGNRGDLRKSAADGKIVGEHLHELLDGIERRRTLRVTGIDQKEQIKNAIIQSAEGGWGRRSIPSEDAMADTGSTEIVTPVVDAVDVDGEGFSRLAGEGSTGEGLECAPGTFR